MSEPLSLPHVATFAVDEGRRYVVEGRCVAEEERNPKGALVQLEFHDEHGGEVDTTLDQWRKNDRYGLNAYATVVPPDTPGPTFSLPVSVPPTAVSMTLHLSPWSTQTVPQLAAPPTARVDRRIFLTEGEVVERRLPVEGGARYRVTGSLEGGWSEPPTAAVMAVEFLDGSGEPIAGEQSHLDHHPEAGLANFRYLASQAPFLAWLEAPEAAAAVRLTFRRWDAAGPIALREEPRLEEAVTLDVDLDQVVTLPHDVSVDVEGNATYVLEGRCVADAERNPNGAVVELSFADAVGVPVPTELEGWRRGAGATLRRHLPVENAAADPPPFSLRVHTPPEAARLDVRLLPWASLAPPQLTGGVRVTRDPRVELHRNDPTERVYALVSPRIHLLRGSIAGGAPASDRVALVSAEFLNEDGDVLPGPYPHFVQSPRPDIGWYQYIPFSGGAEPEPFLVWLEGPAESTHVRLRFLAWADSKGKAIFLGDEPSVDEITGDEMRAIAAEHPDDTRYLSMVARLDAVEGELTRYVGTLRELAARTKGRHAYPPYVRAVGVRRELEPTWLPALPGSSPAPRTATGRRICHLFKVSYPFESTGGAIRNLNTVRSQNRIGLDPYVVTPLNYPATHGVQEFAAVEEVEGVPHVRLGIRGDDQGLPLDRRLAYDAQLTAGVIRERGADIIHAASGYRGYELGLKGLALKRHFRLPLIYEVRSLHEHLWGSARVEDVLDTEWTRLRMAQEERCMAEADAVVTIAEAMREILAGRGVPREKIHVIPNAVDEEKFGAVGYAEDLRAELGLAGKTTIGYISNISRREGHEVLLRAFRELVADHDDLRCLIVGDGPDREKVAALAEALGVRDRVVITGEVDHADINRYYSVIDVFVVPRRPDYASDYVTPLKPFEALALERAMIVADRPSLREIVGSREERGLLFRSGDPQHLAARVRELLDAPERRRRLGAEGRRWILSERTWARNARCYRELYEQVLESAAAPA